MASWLDLCKSLTFEQFATIAHKHKIDTAAMRQPTQVAQALVNADVLCCAAELLHLTKPELVSLCQAVQPVSLSDKGNKPDLAERLIQHFASAKAASQSSSSVAASRSLAAVAPVQPVSAQPVSPVQAPHAKAAASSASAGAKSALAAKPVSPVALIPPATPPRPSLIVNARPAARDEASAGNAAPFTTVYESFSVEQLTRIAGHHKIDTSKLNTPALIARALAAAGIHCTGDELGHLKKEDLVALCMAAKPAALRHDGNKPELVARLVPYFSTDRDSVAAPAGRAVPVAADSPKANQGQWWADKETPFPPMAFGGFSDKSVRQLAIVDGNHVSWHGQVFSLDEWAHKLHEWETAFPNIVRQSASGAKSTFHETEADRCKATTNADNVNVCFAMLPGTNHFIGSKWSEMFRVDMYGNVVANRLLFSDSALCAFDVDHIFCWSRGGRSVRANFAAVQWDANRRVKSDKLVPSLNADEMACGLAPEQFAALMAHAEALAGGKGNRRDIASLQDRVKGWLTQGPSKGRTLSRFRSLMPSHDGATLWAFFRQHYAAEDEDGGAAAAAVEVHVGTSPRKPPPRVEPPPPEHRPRLHVRRRLSGAVAFIEVWGPATYPIKEQLKALGLQWDGDEGRKCWWSVVGEPLVRGLVELCHGSGLELDMVEGR